MKGEVEARWRDDEIAKRLQTKMDDMVVKLKAGATLNQIAADTGLKVVTATDLQRGKAGGFAPANWSRPPSRPPRACPAAPSGDQETTRFVFRVTDVIDPPLDPIASKQITTALQNSYADDLPAPMSRAWKTIWGSRSTSRRSTRSSAALRRL